MTTFKFDRSGEVADKRYSLALNGVTRLQVYGHNTSVSARLMKVKCDIAAIINLYTSDPVGQATFCVPTLEHHLAGRDPLGSCSAKESTWYASPLLSRRDRIKTRLNHFLSSHVADMHQNGLSHVSGRGQTGSCLRLHLPPAPRMTVDATQIEFYFYPYETTEVQ